MYLLRRLLSKVWYHYKLNIKIVFSGFLVSYYVVVGLMLFNISYLLGSLYINNGLFHILSLFMVAILQVPYLKIFPIKENRYEGAPQELVYNAKSKLFFIYFLIFSARGSFPFS